MTRDWRNDLVRKQDLLETIQSEKTPMTFRAVRDLIINMEAQPDAIQLAVSAERERFRKVLEEKRTELTINAERFPDPFRSGRLTELKFVLEALEEPK